MRKRSEKPQIEINLQEQVKASAPEDNQLNIQHANVNKERLQLINNYLCMPTADRPIRL